MKPFEIINLDDENEVKAFIDCHGTIRGRALANRLGLSGRGSKKLANSLSGYAWNKTTAISCRLRGDIQAAQVYERICENIYSELPESVRW